MKPRRGDIALVYFPHSDLTTIKQRPVLVVQADDLGTGLPQLVVAMITSNMSRAGHPSRVAVRLRSAPARTTGLKTDSVIMTDNLATLETTLLSRVLGRMSEMEAVDRALRKTLGL
jgi:mRNA interferase MazF